MGHLLAKGSNFLFVRVYRKYGKYAAYVYTTILESPHPFPTTTTQPRQEKEDIEVLSSIKSMHCMLTTSPGQDLT